MGACYRWNPTRIIISPLLFLLYVNDLPNAISDLSNPTLYADDTSLLIANSVSQMFENDINTVLEKLSTCFHSNLLLLLLNLEKNYSFAICY
jgi:hypothetical protein